MRWYTITIVVIFSILTAAPSPAKETVRPDEILAIEQLIKAPGDLDFCGEPVPFEISDLRERFEKEMLLSLWDRPQVILWLKRSRRYFPLISEQLKTRNLPDDLKYLAVAESALRPHAGSRKGAMGFWQLMPQTGRKYGLQIDEYVDGRRNFYASTRAALDYLKDLHKVFESWTLSIAAYNMGEEGLAAEILEQKTKNYYHLYLPLETQRFVFRVLSVKLILSDPEHFGFFLKEDDYYPPLTFVEIEIDCFQEVPLSLVAEAAHTKFKVIKDLNPELRGHYLAAGNHRIKIPKGASKGFQKRYEALLEKYSKILNDRIYIVRKGDNLTSIADKFGVPLAAIIIWNRIDLNESIHPGDRLIIYRGDLSSIGK